MHRFKAKYVPALDGLRGLAILLVITHHQLIPLALSGGFLGVDLFFVLSGFLITSLLVMEFDATEAISLKNFYLRRVLRLGPALVLYLIASLVVTYHLNPADVVRELRLVGLALAYSTNWRLAFGWDMSLDPTAIIWSLSIEEQFYLVWPLLLLVCLSLRLKRKHLIIGLIVVIATICLHRRQLLAEGAELNRLYYGTDTRADAPLMGCLLALIPHNVFSRALQSFLKFTAIAAACVLVYLVVTVHFTDAFLYRGGYTAIALLAGIMTLTAATQSSWFVKILEFQPLKFFGKISYGLYLWHWLFLQTTTFYFWVGPTLDPWARCLAAIAVSSVSFYLIETRFNRLKSRFTLSSAPTTQRPAAHPTPAIGKLPNAVIIQPSEQKI